ncbi:hypothetical protein GYMLUDRAFT_49574 [Collybiopsis luxurians FD-317 M1]|uniref:Thioesterase domain-containing protein n=1 Tax=Collybiopsis luxurians FD-317 M1 TaxID=944289 RepID=A0A0D0BEJ3_9AGAR|nr:hypothetical protein GYMLUDRAFT_49574 [Collybiopsis luxurians FD-317 M1]
MAHMQGNLPLKLKEENERFFRHFVGTPQTSFGASIGNALQLVQCDIFLPRGEAILEGKSAEEVQKLKKSAESQTICEIDVTKDMCNIYGTLHGGCAAYLIDLCSSTAIVCYGLYTGTDGTGVSTSMNIQWHRPITTGKKLRIVSNTVFVEGIIRSSRSELRDQQTNKLYVSAVHSTLAGGSRTAQLRSSSKEKMGKGGEGKAKL